MVLMLYKFYQGMGWIYEEYDLKPSDEISVQRIKYYKSFQRFGKMFYYGTVEKFIIKAEKLGREYDKRNKEKRRRYLAMLDNKFDLDQKEDECQT